MEVENIKDDINTSKFLISNSIQNIENKFPNSNFIRILFLSNLIKAKGVLILIEACEILKKRKVPFECLIVGEEVDITTAQLNDIIKQKDLIDRVFILGKKYGLEKNQIYFASDIFVFPTYYSNECFPLVLLEAMNYSLPIISTFEGGISDIVEEGITGFLIPQKNVDKLATKLEILINEPSLRQQMGEAGNRKFEHEFKLEIFEKRMTEILHKIVTQIMEQKAMRT